MNVRRRTDGPVSRPEGLGAARTGEEIVDALDGVMAALREEMVRHFHEAGLPRFAAERHVLPTIIHEPGITVNELARRLGRAKSQVSEAVARLVDQGAVRRSTDPSDRRLVRLEVTQAGRDRAGRWHAAYRAMLVHTVLSLSAEDRADLLRGLEALQRALAQPDRSRDAGAAGAGGR